MLVSTAGRLIGALTGPTGNLLNMTGHQVAFRNIMLLTTAMNIGLCFLLIPVYGLMGSAIASSCFIITYNIACVVYIRYKLGFNSFYTPFT
jgi:O-antigen/teichoic acid export membrane protein